MSDFGPVLDEVVDYLNSLSLSQTYTATKSFIPRDDMPELSNLTVVVFPRTFISERITRSTTQDYFGISIVVTKKISAKLTEMDDLLKFCREIFEAIYEHKFPACEFQAEESEISPVYDYDKISANSVFQSMISFNGRQFRAES